ncbi:AMP-binding protein [Paraburkholderia rhynchosiae]|uniref:Acyl-CoA synthetase n=1 Tax=Paraburkholderia rhynchosiae TaxID=487049 RepID=A0A2N7WKH1_9BURK|nr:AMP-binding protein [Paraburkholderia rhynchosiae]PMS29841.1 acyl-CoA synthetase [Paraburkholderia rhynchosiae]CAB3697616.1 Carboxylic acid reductase [Paraburkholderia rhynchosiae]
MNAGPLSHDPLMDVPFRPLRLGGVKATVEERPDGSVVYELEEPLDSYPARLTECLVKWAAVAPDQPLLARRTADGASWEHLTYRQALDGARALGEAMLARGLSPARPLMILSDRSFEHALLALAALHVGVPYVPVTSAYSLLSEDFAKLKRLASVCTPGLVFADDGELYGRALRDVFGDVECVVSGKLPEGRTASWFFDWLDTPVTAAVDQAFDKVGPDTIGKIMFTSGTTGAPKGVIYSQRMLCSNRQQVAQTFAFLQDAPPVLVDWLPWHHTFGGTHNFGMVLYGGGTYYLDPGKPTPEQIGPTLDALREIAPVIYLNTPQGLAALIPHLRSDDALRENFFSKLALIYYGGASLPEYIWAALDELAVKTIGQRVLIMSGLGGTEAGPTPMSAAWDPRRQAIAGLPVPGVKVKVVPVGEKLEIRYAGDCVTPGYWKDPERTRASFDEEGYFCSGDAGAFIDPERRELGLRFDGRLAENFKLSSGTWVNVAELRLAALNAFSPYARDVVIAGHDQGFLAALVFPDLQACRALCGDLLESTPDAEQILASAGVREHFQRGLDLLATRSGGSSSRIERIVLESAQPTLDNGELSAKGAISQANVLARRRDVVAELYEAVPTRRTLVAQRGSLTKASSPIR